MQAPEGTRFLALRAARYDFFTTSRPMNDQPPDPEQIVETQLRAYNDRSIDAFLATYAEDVEIYEFPARLMMQGHAQLRERYAKVFADELLHAVIAERIVMGNVVIDHERVARTLEGGPGVIEAVAIYEVRHGTIARVTFIQGSRVVGAKL